MRPTEEIERLLGVIESHSLKKESDTCNPSYASLSENTRGRVYEEGSKKGRHRTEYALDRDRILYCKSFFRLAGKTQVFMSPRNPLISNRMTHTLHVAQISRAIARALDLNEDLTEAIALGHDLGHPPFGHKGEKILDDLSRKHLDKRFEHNVHAVRLIDTLEKNGRGLNLTYEAREGIIRHCGETEKSDFKPGKPADSLDFNDYSPENDPSTLEGCVVKLCDRIAYVGKDIEDAAATGIIDERDIPTKVSSVLGTTNGQIIDTLVKDLIMNFHKDREEFASQQGAEPSKDDLSIRLSEPISQALNALITDFNYPKIYLSEANMRYERHTEHVVNAIFEYLLAEIEAMTAFEKSQASLVEFEPENGKTPLSKSSLGELEKSASGHTKEELANAKKFIIEEKLKKFDGSKDSILYHLAQMDEEYWGATFNAQMVIDYITLMTDDMAVQIYDSLMKPKPIA